MTGDASAPPHGSTSWNPESSAHPAHTALQPTPVLVALIEDAFADAVRAALRDIPRPDRLRHNPLTSSRVVRDAGPEATLADVLRQAHAALPDDPRTENARRTLDRTYFHGATYQEAAAEVLHMAFSTYRRHLKAGVDALTSTLW